MRVTQGMLINNNIKYLSQNYDRLSKLNEQMMTGKKISKPSDDPVVAMNGMHYRSQVVEISQFKRNLNEGFNWLENADSTLNETGQVLQRIRELTVQASNDSNDPTARRSIADEIGSLQEHLVALADTKVGDTYIFSGTDTDKKPITGNQINIEFDAFMNQGNKEGYVISYQGQTFKYDPNDVSGNTFLSVTGEKMVVDPETNGVTYQYQEALEYRNGELADVQKSLKGQELVISHESAVSSNTEDVVIEVMKGVKLPINIKPNETFSIELFSGLESLKKMINDPETKGTDINQSLEYLDQMLDNIVSTRSELGARTNRAEMVHNRLLEQEVIATQTVSENEDIDFEQVLIDLTLQESLHKASLSVGARLIQPTLMDFLR
ncbi:flagellar hook-associated protein FlgL [Bacillus sp. V3B]|uniref:flagellar hook-associated protein FlgL n=1 Tax=Bacillus sp. V3B TaxID=2804915 RepID=UPI00210EF49F|nr:flagellar hook-associated protein FlgL [Bacillus sp. V3B]MCQ6277135.1 flagellar hook-associated protein FlgL [Bacillus sp. V3B]